ncbi:hypothetical protein BDZ94DRAFT_1252261 [Collybia nuda]|uniref:histidine kinase n=1 Tax=Collybia nuda TaxID=64659 RepID=A0A9P5YCC3_9AGAR|nr:hypothetical protein BDZ94DRAFT_1252261 [Collybia nuda]
MPFWSAQDQSAGYSASSKWTEDVAMPTLHRNITEKGHAGSSNVTPATSTAVDSLPIPVLQNSGSHSVASRRKRKSARISGLSVHWAKFKRRVGTGTAPSSSSLIGESAAESSYTRRIEGNAGLGDNEEVNEVVVDRIWSEEIKSSVTHSDHGGSPEKSGGSHPVQPSNSDHESLSNEGFWSLVTPLIFLRWRLWPAIVEIFSSKFVDEKDEHHYAQENWFLKKSLAFVAALWLILNWVLGCIFASPIFQNYDRGFYFAVAPALSFPVVFMVMFDWPRDKPISYQIFLTVSVWSWSFYQIIFMYLCGYYSNAPHKVFTCQGRDFLATFYYTTALQAIALFGLKMDRLPAAIGASSFFVLACSLMIPLRKTWIRSMINFLLFHSFLIYVHYMRESSERRLYHLRNQLKIQYKATERAKNDERKAADSKRRLTSYVFHEVRVPLNTALLAVQNMEASGTVAREQEIEFSALKGSLSMMSKVLNDVLDFNRMDSGKFESAFRPYGFHQVMQSLFVPLRLATDARGLVFVTELDPKIDEVARRAAYEAMGETSGAIEQHMDAHPEVEGVVLGDESRLRQIITNLASNACKFTPAGGKLCISTKLIMPPQDGASHSLDCAPPNPSPSSLTGQHEPIPLSATHLSQHNNDGKHPALLEWIVVRIEVTDTGYGIKPRDMAQSKLFSAFNQTEQGRQQGGKGTGLGLALVRQIVKLSGGRLGVKSKVGKGSTFWVELPLGVGRKTLIASAPPDLESQQDSYTTDLEKIFAAAETEASLPKAMSNSVSMAVDAAALRASQAPSISPRSSAAIHGLMEQDGRVELVLHRQESRPPMLIRQSSEDPIQPSPTIGVISRPASSESSPHPTTKHTSQRPTYVPLPSPQSFSSDIHSTSPLTTSDQLTPPTSPLAAFDASYARGSPSSSNPAINIEPGLPVLVVDDDPLTRTLMTRILTRLGCNVSTAENGEVALEMILGPQGKHALTPSSDASGNLGPILEQEQERTEFTEEGKYALVFLDNQMPVLSGLKAVEKLRQLGRSDLIIGVTGNALLTDQKEYLDAGVDRVLTKPVLERSLKDMLVLADERRKRDPPHPDRAIA